MARARNIKPSFFQNEELAELPFEARLLFIGLWTLADREGRLEDRPKRIKMALFPADNIDAEQFLNSLETVGLLKRYVQDGLSVIQVVNFVKHQAPHGLEKDSELPDENGFYTKHNRNAKGLASGKCEPEFYTKQQLKEKNNSFLTLQEPLEPESLPCHNRLNPDSLNPDSLNPEEKRRRASRLPDSWQPSPELLAWAKAERPDLDTSKTIASFGDYWRGKAGKDGAKLDWDATFRNWVRSERSVPVQRPFNASGMTAAEESQREADRRNARRPGPDRGLETLSKSLAAAVPMPPDVRERLAKAQRAAA